MLILAIESSCDDMSASVVKDGRVVVSNVVSSQNDIHNKYGGIVPELASRRHIETVVPVVEEALFKAGVKLSDVECIGVTSGPGLVGSILVGLTFAKAAAYVAKKPLIPVDHIKAHALSAFISDKEGAAAPEFPFVSFVVSGGHTTLFLVEDFTKMSVLGETRDDAAGEAFDKAAKLMGLGYPGGVLIDRLARNGDKAAYSFTKPRIKSGALEFSFSGLKTAVLLEVQKASEVNDEFRRNMSASFQEAVVDALLDKAFRAVKETGVKSLSIAGGVACNSRLRERAAELASGVDIGLFIPPPKYCTDNAAMIGHMAYRLYKEGVTAGLELNAEP
ncbi:MAG: tRNA (adenosine(37)-N6)-threonylcarbamoyltransferase complex transferase subunit TsaD [Deltaproteobacteria bacterium]|nr:tRNA (adenosine(37)-N6)-threonylcarbamoyltransferase complex transferase subunit TsaD [Deltaproteobacteria bacterium]